MRDASHAEANKSAVSCQAEASTATALIELCEQQCGVSQDVCGNRSEKRDAFNLRKTANTNCGDTMMRFEVSVGQFAQPRT